MLGHAEGMPCVHSDRSHPPPSLGCKTMGLNLRCGDSNLPVLGLHKPVR